MSYIICPVCRSPALERKNWDTLVSSIECFRCGPFRSDHDAPLALEHAHWTEEQIANASGYIRRNAGLFLTNEQVTLLSSLPMPSVAEKAAWLLIQMGRAHPQPGVSFPAPVWDVQSALGTARSIASSPEPSVDARAAKKLHALEWLAVASASNDTELHWLIFDCLLAQGWLSSGRSDGAVVIAPRGWQEIDRLQQINATSRLGFIAMCFQEEFNPLFEQGIAVGIDAAGYEPRRVDRMEHNNRIDDEIIASIKQSRFLVADFTMNRGGIYFEAGYGLGLGLPVIWLVREDKLDEVHFDNRQYNFIAWKDGEWKQLAERLRYRIEATIGRGPLSKTKPNP